jgi:perosamine synthetase
MTNICAAIGCAQLENANELIKMKRQLAEWYNKSLEDLPLQTQKETEDIFHTYWMYTIMVEKRTLRNNLRKFLGEKGIETRPGFFPVHKMPMYRNGNVSFPAAEVLSESSINLPSYPDLTEKDVDYISEQIKLFYKDAG